jgi:hypothetical protein
MHADQLSPDVSYILLTQNDESNQHRTSKKREQVAIKFLHRVEAVVLASTQILQNAFGIFFDKICKKSCLAATQTSTAPIIHLDCVHTMRLTWVSRCLGKPK